MAQSTSPTPPHRSKGHPQLHVDLRGKAGKIHVPVKNKAASAVIGTAARQAARKDKGRA